MNRERSVFVGSIPYSVSVEEVVKVLETVGPVLAFRMQPDHETGKHKGYGFAEYPSEMLAKLAIKNLNGYELEGRPLRINTATVGGGGGGNRNETTQLKDIEVAISQLSNAELYDMLAEMKSYIQKEPQEARRLLEKKPVLAQALLKAQQKLAMIQQAPTNPAKKIKSQHPAPPGNMPGNNGPPHGFQQRPMNQGWNQPMQGQHGGRQYPYNNGPPPQPGMPPALPPNLAPPPGAMNMMPPQGGGPQNPALMSQLQQVLSLNEQQINELPPGQREVVMQLRQQYRS